MDNVKAIAYEARGLEAVRAETSANLDAIREFGREIESMGLSGWPPNTELFVVVVDKGTRRTLTWPIWLEGPFTPPNDSREGDHLMFVDIIWSDLMDPSS